jgi:hypothetical protein
MELYFTTSAGPDLVQTDPKISLGGYKSSSQISNSSLNNLFDEVSTFKLSRDLEEEYIGIILRNNSLDDIENLWLYFKYPENCYSKFLVGAVDLAVDSNGNQYMEHITDRFSKPFNAEFYEADGVLNAVEIGDIPSGGLVGLWICRRINNNLPSTICDESNLYQTVPTSDLKVAIELQNTDVISICFRYGPEYYDGPIGDDLV